MNWLSDDAIVRLQTATAQPDLSATRYRIVERIASGGMGTVYLAEDSVLGRRVALKVLDVPDASGELAARLLREAKILARLEHPGIVPVHDAGTLADGRVFYAMKLVEGERLDRLVSRGESLPHCLRLFQRICDAVAFAHARQILHRDLKPENIMVGPFGEVLVMDWGIAKSLRAGSDLKAATQSKEADHARDASDSAITAHGAILGTPGYMAPEQARGEVGSLDERSDVYSLGAILQYLLNPGLDSSASASRPLAAIARKTMASNPADRYTSAGELGLDVARYLDGLPVSAYPENIWRRAARWAARYRVAIVLVLTYLIVRTLLLLWFRR
ncbi:MAG TPA: serine/threonine-protein kinase [Candidatus Acidoferrales bacterium]|nr:serine/threonine-protein kinase [Candidatus Acidoferrales bacterium]